MKLALPMLNATALSAVLGMTSACDSIFSASRSEQHTLDHVADAPLNVEIRNGSVEIVGDPDADDVRIEAELTAGGTTPDRAQDRLADVRLTMSRDTSGQLNVRTIFPEPYVNGDRVEIVIRIPAVEGTEVTTRNGHITVTKLDGPLKAKSRNGRIEVRDWIGNVDLETRNGRITLQRLDGNASVETRNGRITVENVRGDLDVTSRNGAVSIDEQAGRVAARTRNGRLHLNLTSDHAGPFNLETRNGAVRVSVGPAFDGRINMNSRGGRVQVDDQASLFTHRELEQHRGTVAVRMDGPVSQVRTRNGRITVQSHH